MNQMEHKTVNDVNRNNANRKENQSLFSPKLKYY